nr:WYL domain-containing protein [Corynebacterium lactis]
MTAHPASSQSGGRTTAPGSTHNSRLIHLLLALADAPRGLRVDWILGNVPGYVRQAPETAERYLRGDITALRERGIVIDESGSGVARTLRLDREQWTQQDPGLNDAEEAALFAAANAVFTSEELQDAARAGWAKIAAFGKRETIAKPGESVVVSDKLELNRAQLATLLRALTPPRTAVEFWYSRQFGVDDEQRQLEPWRIINIRGRFYLLGYDTQRRDARMFRFSRISDVVDTRSAATIPVPEGNLQEQAERMLERDAAKYPAVVRVRPGTCVEVVDTAESLGSGRFRTEPMTIDAIVRLGLSYAPDLVVESPHEAREAIVERLRAVAEVHQLEGGVKDGR